MTHIHTPGTPAQASHLHLLHGDLPGLTAKLLSASQNLQPAARAASLQAALHVEEGWELVSQIWTSLAGSNPLLQQLGAAILRHRSTCFSHQARMFLVVLTWGLSLPPAHRYVLWEWG